MHLAAPGCIKVYTEVMSGSRNDRPVLVKLLETLRGRPGPDTEYRRVTRRRYDLEWSIDQAAIDYDKKSDGMYPLVCNDRNLSAAQILEAHKGQPSVEKRFEQIKTVHEIAPVFLKNTMRIEAFFTLYFLAFLVQALIERELRLTMKRKRVKELPIYPRTTLLQAPDHRADPASVQPRRTPHAAALRQAPSNSSPPPLTELQRQTLDLLGVPGAPSWPDRSAEIPGLSSPGSAECKTGSSTRGRLPSLAAPPGCAGPMPHPPSQRALSTTARYTTPPIVP
jgi:hypothetical protein